uniref:Uncharacterized protein n=1 Tax=Photinus pyralis TaxID=7054 RepID=A0A1Y1K4L0_PHOPY
MMKTLRYAAEGTAHLALLTSFVTMDRSLYLKSRDITSTSLSNIEMIPGRFHTLTSILGCIGLKEHLAYSFAPNSVENMLNGKAYNSAVRGHLTRTAHKKVPVSPQTTNEQF